WGRHHLLFVLQAVAWAHIDEFDFSGKAHVLTPGDVEAQYPRCPSTTPASVRKSAPASRARILVAICATDSSRWVRAEACGVTVIFGWRQNGCAGASGS